MQHCLAVRRNITPPLPFLKFSEPFQNGQNLLFISTLFDRLFGFISEIHIQLLQRNILLQRFLHFRLGMLLCNFVEVIHQFRRLARIQQRNGYERLL